MHNIVIIGGGSSAHTAAPILAEAGNNVSILTSRPSEWKKKITSKHVTEDGRVIKKFSGELNEISNSYEKLVPEADIILLCMPVYQYPDALRKTIKNVGEKKVYIGTVYGQGGFDWMVECYSNEFKKYNIIPFAIGLIPWVCRIEKYGEIGITYGAKSNNVISIVQKEDFDFLNKSFLPDLCEKHFGKGQFHYCNNFISSTLSVDNQIIHTSRMFGLAIASGGKWNEVDSVPLFYKDYDQLSADLLKELDSDYEKIREKIRATAVGLDLNYMLNYLDLEHFSYGSSSPDILSSFKESPTLGAIKTPTVEDNGFVIMDKNHRFFFDDIYFGLVIAKWIACEGGISTPTIDRIIYWAQDLLEDNIIDEKGKLSEKLEINGMPSRWGINSINEILK